MTTWMMIFAMLAVAAFVIAAVQSFPDTVREPADRAVRPDPRSVPGQRPAARRALRVPEDRC